MKFKLPLLALTLVAGLLVAFNLGASAATQPKKVRFIARGDYVEDTQTGLLWQRDGDASGKRNYYEAAEYAKRLKLGGLTGWRVATRDELAAIFPAAAPPFKDTKYSAKPKGPEEMNSYWTSDLDTRLEDYAYVYQWYGEGVANNCYASKNFVYVRCVRDPVKKAAKPSTRPS